MSDANGTNPNMWRECIPPQTPPPVIDGIEVKPKATKVRLFSDLFSWWRSARESKLRVKIARLEMRLAAAEYERDLLVEVNKNLSTWIAASTATVSPIAAMLGGREKQPPPAPPKRTGGAY